MTEIYYVEDDENIAWSVKEYLESRGCSVSIFATIAKAKEALTAHIPSLILLDWNMPDGRGDTFCQWIRLKWKELPVILLTVRGDSQDIVSGLSNGADDYVVKPFTLEVLHSRILALLRRAGHVTEHYLSCGGLSLDKDKKTVFIGDEEAVLSQTEYRVLLLLLENKGRTVARERLLEQIWDSNGNFVNDNTLTVTMKRLREKLRQPQCLKTIRSFGYRIEETKTE